ncbi:hypothetical protein Clacol_008852 [Clathrus columnatus]|uniref:Histidinol-phosphatase n=1 Tax=Clathrus columnatus TaxID=1419009 RepID=A0AAV5AQC5_9AGAM|nr:hypothetical protein Clacol_008852 [Clathrus columnatus]
MLFSLHSHSGQFCKHAESTLEEVVQQAIAYKFDIYGLTEHVPRYRMQDLYPEEEGLTLEHLIETFDKFIREAYRLKQLYADRITLLVGLETEYITDGDLVGLQKLLERYETSIQYIVGSVHHVKTIPIDLNRSTFQRSVQECASGDGDRTELFLHEYFDAQFTVIQRFRPEVIGHFDLCRLYAPDLEFSAFPEVWKKIERNVQFAIDYGALFELNAAAFRKGWEHAYPGIDIVQYIKERGGRFTLSDDSHGAHMVGQNYRRLKEYLTKAAINELWYLKTHNEKSTGRSLVPILCKDTVLT